MKTDDPAKLRANPMEVPTRGQRHRRLLPACLAARLLAAHEATGLSYRQVADHIGIDVAMWWRLTRGERCPRRETAHRIIEALDLPDEIAEALLNASV